MQIFILRECSDYDEVYGGLIVEDSKLCEAEVQERINTIKTKFNKIGRVTDWTIEDVIEQLNEDGIMCSLIELGNVEI